MIIIIKVRYLIIFFLLLTIQSCIKQNNDFKYNIKPGVGVDNMTFKESNIEDAKNYLGKNYTLRTAVGHADGRDFQCYYRWTEVSSKYDGIEFRFSTDCVDNPDTLIQKLVRITFTDTDSCCLDSKICLGKSKYEEIINIYGLPYDEWENESYLKYENPDISFRFDDNGYLREISLY